MGLIFAWTLMGLPLLYAIWLLVQGRKETQMANHTRMGSDPTTFQTRAVSGSSSQSNVNRTELEPQLLPRPIGFAVKAGWNRSLAIGCCRTKGDDPALFRRAYSRPAGALNQLRPLF